MNKVTFIQNSTDRFDWYYGFLLWRFRLQVIHVISMLELSDEWDDASDKMNVLGMQYFVAQYGNGLDAYNFYRRTGYPTTLQPNIEPNPGGFIRSFFYPANHANTKSKHQPKGWCN